MNTMFSRLWPPPQRQDRTENSSLSSTIFDPKQYSDHIENIRDIEFPFLKGTVYLDHAGTTPYPKSVIESYASELAGNLFGNPHSASAASQLSTRRIDDVRLKVLHFFNTNAEEFDLVFVANATAAIKLVGEAFRDHEGGFDFYYHRESHTSMVGVRELATCNSSILADDLEVDQWISGVKNKPASANSIGLFGYPGQSNMTGRRLPLSWCHSLRNMSELQGRRIYSLLDAASLTSTSSLDLGDSDKAPDFVAVSFYKIFGFPDLGGLLVRRSSAEALLRKRFFAGGTVDAVAVSHTPWHEKKTSIHAALEEGTLAFHNIIALDHAMVAHKRLFGPMSQVTQHTCRLAHLTRSSLNRMKHSNGSDVCELYGQAEETSYGPVVSFNLRDNDGHYVSAAEVEKLCIVKGFQIRTGGLCNPGGISQHLKLTEAQIRTSYESGRRCGDGNDLIEGQPIGAIRVSYGAMSTESDMNAFLSFLHEYYVAQNVLDGLFTTSTSKMAPPQFYITDLAVFPIKSCAAFHVPANSRWEVTSKGLAWDREWCLVHQGTGVALSQKKYPRMALLQPRIDLTDHTLTLEHNIGGEMRILTIGLDDDSETTTMMSNSCTGGSLRTQSATVCGDKVVLQAYSSKEVNDFFSDALEVPCCLARYPVSADSRTVNMRRPKTQLSAPGALPRSQNSLANESPMLIVSESSVDELNAQIKNNACKKGIGKVEVSARSFRPNITIAEQQGPTRDSSAYAEETWTSVDVVPQHRAVPPGLHTNLSSSPTLKAAFTHGTPSLDSSSEGGTNDAACSGAGSLASSFTSLSDDSQNNQTKALMCSKKVVTPVKIDILGPCQRCQMVSINQKTALSQQEPFSTLAKTRRKGDGRVWFGVHAALNPVEKEGRKKYLQVGDLIIPSI